MEILTAITLSKTPQITKKNRSNEMVGVNASENSVAIRVIFVKRRNKQTKKNNNKIHVNDNLSQYLPCSSQTDPQTTELQ